VAGIEQAFDCLIVQNRQAEQPVRRSMDWTSEDNMVDGLFFCATLTGRRESHTPFVHIGAETLDTGAEAVKSDPSSSWEGRSEGWVWKKVLFSDESHFFVQGQQCRQEKVRRSYGEKITKGHILQNVKHPQKIMFWGCFSFQGVGPLYHVTGMMNAEKLQ